MEQRRIYCILSSSCCEVVVDLPRRTDDTLLVSFPRQTTSTCCVNQVLDVLYTLTLGEGRSEQSKMSRRACVSFYTRAAFHSTNGNNNSTVSGMKNIPRYTRTRHIRIGMYRRRCVSLIPGCQYQPQLSVSAGTAVRTREGTMKKVYIIV